MENSPAKAGPEAKGRMIAPGLVKGIKNLDPFASPAYSDRSYSPPPPLKDRVTDKIPKSTLFHSTVNL